MKKSLLLTSLGIISISAATTQAALLVYEGFNYVLSDNVTMNGVASSATGLTGNYELSGSGTSSANFRTAGLTFSSSFFATAGGSLQTSVSGSGAVARLGVALNAGTQTGTIWNSYLVNINSRAESNTQLSLLTRVANTINTAPAADRSFQVLSNGATSANPGVGYNDATVDSTGSALTNSTTYLAIAKFTNVGATLTAGDPGVATLWVLDEAGYDNWRTLGSSLESNLGTYATWTATQSITSGSHAFNNSRFLQFGAFSPVAATNITGQVDEVRWGTTLAAVAVPEPSTWALLAAGLTIFVVFRRRRLC